MASPAGHGLFLMTQYIPSSTSIVIPQGASAGQSPVFMQKFIKGKPSTLGAVQLMIAVTHLFLGGILCSAQDIPVAVLSGVVFWAGLFFLISGSLSIAAETKGTRSLVKGSLGMNIVSTISAVIAFIIYSIDFGFYNSNYYLFMQNNPKDVYVLSFENGILAFLLILSVLEFGISMITSVFGCKAVCCCSNSQEAQPVIVMQNSLQEDPRFHLTHPGGISMPPEMPTGQGLTMAHGIPLVQGMEVLQGIPTSYGISVVPGIPTAQGMPTANRVTAAAPPPYHKYETPTNA